MTGRVRRVDRCPDEVISNVAGKLSPMDLATYCAICSPITSRGEPNGSCTTQPWTVWTLGSRRRSGCRSGRIVKLRMRQRR